MKFSFENKNNKELLKYIIILISLILLVSIFTFIPVNTLNFFVNLIGLFSRYGSVVIVIYLFINIINLFKIYNEDNKKVLMLYLILSWIIYLICFYLNVIKLIF